MKSQTDASVSMKCIFCGSDSSGSRAVEHVIPESIGNTEHILKPGIVCDTCNNYFASKVEGPLMSDPYFRYQCSQADIPSKKGRPARVRGLHPRSRSTIELQRNLDGSGISVGAAFEKDEERWTESVLNSETGSIYVPLPTAPDKVLMSRFLAEAAVECLALRIVDLNGGADEIVSERGLDPIRDYARRGIRNRVWPFHARRLYPAAYGFVKPGQEPYEVIHEWVFDALEGDGLYFVFALFGVEYTLNLGEPEIDSYQAWLSANSDRSPLYPNGL
jgi:hypothetical protein